MASVLFGTLFPDAMVQQQFLRRDMLQKAGAVAGATVVLPDLATAAQRPIGPALGDISGKPLPLTVGLGTCLVRGDDAARTVGLGINAGYRVFDTAQRRVVEPGYGNEGGVGKGIRQAVSSGVTRSELFVGTKVWVDNMGAGKTSRSVKESAAALGLEYLDQLLIHWPGQFVCLPVESTAHQGLASARGCPGADPRRGQPRPLAGTGGPATRASFSTEVRRGEGDNDATNAALRRETWHELEGLLAAGLVRSIGVHPYNQRGSLVELCQKHGIIVNSYCPLGGKGNKGQVTDVLLKDPVINAIGAAHGKTAAQAILRWHLQRGLTPIPKGSSKAHIVENFGVFDFALTAEEMGAVRGLNRDQFALFDADALA